MKPWQHGYELDYLKTAALPFKKRFKKYVYGAFGIPKERDVADALAKGRCAILDDGGEVAAMVSVLKTPGRHTDFTGHVVIIPKGALYISALAWTKGNASRARQLLQTYLGKHRDVWYELHEEDQRAKDMALALGFQWVTTKVSAGSTITGLYRRDQRAARGMGKPYQLGPAELPGICCLQGNWLAEGERKRVLAEAKALADHWASHYSSYNKGGTWTAMALRGYDPADPTFIIKPAEMSKKWKAENPERLKAKAELTTAAPLAPATMALLKSLPVQRFDRVRFMKLAPGGGELTRHADITDRDAGVSDNKVTRLHIPLKTNALCEFQSWDARGQLRTLCMSRDGLYYLDQRKPHACCNKGDNERIHLVVDAYGTKELRQLIAKGT